MRIVVTRVGPEHELVDHRIAAQRKYRENTPSSLQFGRRFDNSLVQQKTGDAPNQQRDDSKADFWTVYKRIGLISASGSNICAPHCHAPILPKQSIPSFRSCHSRQRCFAFGFCETQRLLAFTCLRRRQPIPRRRPVRETESHSSPHAVHRAHLADRSGQMRRSYSE